MYNLANNYGFLKRHADAVKLHQETFERRKAKLGADDPHTLMSMWGVAANLDDLGRGAEALPIIDECMRRVAAAKITNPNFAGLLNHRLGHFQKLKDAAGCRATAEMWENLQRTDASSLYSASCYRAVTAAVIRSSDDSPGAVKQANAEADRAMSWLKQAVAAGYRNLPKVKKDKDLDSLRDRADFKKLIAEIPAGH